MLNDNELYLFRKYIHGGIIDKDAPREAIGVFNNVFNRPSNRERFDFDDNETPEDLLLDLPDEEIDRLFEEMLMRE